MTDTSYVSYGSYRQINNSQIEITELPIRNWTDKYKEFLESMIIDSSKDKKSKQYLRNYTSQCTDNKVHFTLTFASDVLEDIIEDKVRNVEGQNKFEKLFKLTSKINTGNMVLYNEKGFLKKYKNVSDILKNYFKVRLDLYHKRKLYQLDSLKKELVIVNAKVRFIMEFIEGKIIISNRSKKNLIEQLVDGKYPMVNDDNEFGYLIKMPIYNLTKERIDELQKDRDTKTEMFNKLEKTSETKLWTRELDSLKKEYLKFLEMKKSNEEDVETKKKKIIKKKKNN
jgi:DNA topoisomerase-2